MKLVHHRSGGKIDMMKKVLALVLAGILTLGSVFTVLAAEDTAEAAETEVVAEEAEPAAEDVAEAAEAEAISEEAEPVAEEEASEEQAADGEEDVIGALVGLIGAFGGEKVTGLEEDLGSLVGILDGLGEEVSNGLEAGIGALLGVLGGEDNAKNLIGVIELMGTGVLATIEAEGGKVAEVIAQFKNEDGTYDFDKLLELLENSKESEDGKLVTIGEVEIAAEELSAAIEKALVELFAEDEAAETEAEAVDEAEVAEAEAEVVEEAEEEIAEAEAETAEAEAEAETAEVEAEDANAEAEAAA